MDQRRSLVPVLLLLVLLVSALVLAPSATLAQDGPQAAEQAPVTLTLLHNNDGESALLPTTNVVEPSAIWPNTETVELQVGGIGAFATVMENQIMDANDAGNAVLTVYAGDAFLASSVIACSQPPLNNPIYDAIAQRQLPYDAHIIGNHEFDFGPGFLAEFINTFDTNGGVEQPFLSANLDFSAEDALNGLVDDDGLINQTADPDKPLAKAMIYTDPGTSAVFGIVGATTPTLPIVSSPGDVEVTEDLAATAAAVQAEIDRLETEGVDKIIFVSHLQDIDNDQELIGMLSGIDVAVAGGGDEVLVNPDVPLQQQLLPGEEEEPFGDYPFQVEDADGNTVYVVTTRGNYKYLGRFDVNFDADGEVTGFDMDMSYPRPVVPEGANEASVLMALGIEDMAVPEDEALVTSVIEPVSQCLEQFAETDIAFSEVVLDVSRGTVRSEESNAGNLIADAFIYTYEDLAAANDIEMGDPVVAITNGGGIRQNAGDFLVDVITRQNTLDVLPFGNNVSVIEDVMPETLKEIFEHAVSEELPQGRFLQVGGIMVTYDMSEPMGSRVVSLMLPDGTDIVEDGEVVTGAPSVDLVTNSFLATGGDGYAMLEPLERTDLEEDGVTLTYERAWVKYLTEADDDFPIPAGEDLPHILASDERYQPGGEGRIKFIVPTYLPIIFSMFDASAD